MYQTLGIQWEEEKKRHNVHQTELRDQSGENVVNDVTEEVIQKDGDHVTRDPARPKWKVMHEVKLKDDGKLTRFS